MNATLSDRLLRGTMPIEEIFEKLLHGDREALVREHVVEGVGVLPAGAIVEMALAAGRSLVEDATTLRQLQFPAPLRVASGASVLARLTLRSDRGTEPPGAWVFELRGSAPDSPISMASDAPLCASGVIEPTPRSVQDEDVALPSSALPSSAGHVSAMPSRSRFPDSVSVAAYYEDYRRRGIGYGPSLQVLRAIWKGRGEVWAELVAPTSNAHFRLDPHLADGALQALAVLVGDWPVETRGPEFLTLPVTIGSIHSDRPTPRRVFAHAVQRSTKPGAWLRGDVTLWAEPGGVVAAFEDVHLQRVRRQVVVAGAAPANDPVPLRRWVWDAAPGRVDAKPPQGVWLLLADPMGVSTVLRHRLEAAGSRCHLVSIDDADDLAIQLELAQTHGPLVGVVHMWSVPPLATADEMPGSSADQRDDRARDAARWVGSAHDLIQALVVGTKGAVPVYWVTVDAHDVNAQNDVNASDGRRLRPDAAALWGFARSSVLEEPRLAGRSIDLDGEALRTDEDLAAGLWQELTEPTRSSKGRVLTREVAHRAGARWVPRLEELPPVADAGATIRAGGAYLITGGLGGLGLALAHDLANRGAGHVALLGRTKLPPKEQWAELAIDETIAAPERERFQALLALEARGLDVWVDAVDVADPAALRTLIDRFARHCGGLHGVFHLAAQAHDGLIRSTSPEAVRAVLRPKVAGSLAVASATADHDVDFLVFFSSATAVFGNLGQADYGAANAFTEAFAADLRRRGRPALALSWGLWGEVGMGTDLVEVLRGRGFEALGTTEGLEALHAAISLRDAQLVVARFHGAGPRSALLAPSPVAHGSSQASVQDVTLERPDVSTSFPDPRAALSDVRKRVNRQGRARRAGSSPWALVILSVLF